MRHLAITLLLLLGLTVGLSAATDATPDVYLRTTDAVTQIPVASIQTLTFPTTGGLAITLRDGTVTEASAQEFLELLFSRPSDFDALAAPEAQTARLRLDGRTLTAPAGAITLYGPDGHRAAFSPLPTMDLSALPTGTSYIAVCDGQVLKFILQ